VIPFFLLCVIVLFVSFSELSLLDSFDIFGKIRARRYLGGGADSHP